MGSQSWSGRIWRRENILTPPGLEPQAFQPVAIHYTKYAVPVGNTWRRASVNSEPLILQSSPAACDIAPFGPKCLDHQHDLERH